MEPNYEYPIQSTDCLYRSFADETKETHVYSDNNGLSKKGSNQDFSTGAGIYKVDSMMNTIIQNLQNLHFTKESENLAVNSVVTSIVSLSSQTQGGSLETVEKVGQTLIEDSSKFNSRTERESDGSASKFPVNNPKQISVLKGTFLRKFSEGLSQLGRQTGSGIPFLRNSEGLSKYAKKYHLLGTKNTNVTTIEKYIGLCTGLNQQEERFLRKRLVEKYAERPDDFVPELIEELSKTNVPFCELYEEIRGFIKTIESHLNESRAAIIKQREAFLSIYSQVVSDADISLEPIQKQVAELLTEIDGQTITLSTDLFFEEAVRSLNEFNSHATNISALSKDELKSVIKKIYIVQLSLYQHKIEHLKKEINDLIKNTRKMHEEGLNTSFFIYEMIRSIIMVRKEAGYYLLNVIFEAQIKVEELQTFYRGSSFAADIYRDLTKILIEEKFGKIPFVTLAVNILSKFRDSSVNLIALNEQIKDLAGKNQSGNSPLKGDVTITLEEKMELDRLRQIKDRECAKLAEMILAGMLEMKRKMSITENEHHRKIDAPWLICHKAFQKSLSSVVEGLNTGTLGLHTPESFLIQNFFLKIFGSELTNVTTNIAFVEGADEKERIMAKEITFVTAYMQAITNPESNIQPSKKEIAMLNELVSFFLPDAEMHVNYYAKFKTRD